MQTCSHAPKSPSLARVGVDEEFSCGAGGCAKFFIQVRPRQTQRWHLGMHVGIFRFVLTQWTPICMLFFFSSYHWWWTFLIWNACFDMPLGDYYWQLTFTGHLLFARHCGNCFPGCCAWMWFGCVPQGSCADTESPLGVLRGQEASSTIMFRCGAFERWMELCRVIRRELSWLNPDGFIRWKRNDTHMYTCFLSLTLWCSAPPQASVSKKAVTRCSPLTLHLQNHDQNKSPFFIIYPVFGSEFLATENSLIHRRVPFNFHHNLLTFSYFVHKNIEAH
jgi:hypothetical protein